MNSRLIKSTIYLAWVFLLGFSVLKIFFTDAFVLILSNTKISMIGGWIDNYVWVEQIILFFTSHMTYFLYTCACLQTWNLSYKQHIVVACVNVVLCLLRFFTPSIGSGFDLCFMVLIPCIFGANYTQSATIFTTHSVGQLLLLLIRSKPMLLLGVDFATQFLLSADAYLWLLVYYLYSNLYKEAPLWEVFVRHSSETSLGKLWKQNSRKFKPK